MKEKDFVDMIYKGSGKDYGLCPPPCFAQKGLNILIDHFLGENWYITLCMGSEQVNTIAIAEILRLYPNNKIRRIHK